MAYSDKINDPAFAKYLSDTARYARIFSWVLAIAAVLGFLLYGEFSNDMDNPEALYVGLIIGGMFIVIAWVINRSKKKGKSWDGTVTDKKIETKQRHKNDSDMDNTIWEYQLYKIIIKSDNGKKHSISVKDDDNFYNYYQINDKVRYHGNLNTYEKFDKSSDVIIFCNACSSLNEITSDNCHRCHCPLLK